MRTRRSVFKPNNKLPFRKHWTYQTRDESNGKPIILDVPRPGDRFSGYKPYFSRVKAVKPYQVALANGRPFPDKPLGGTYDSDGVFHPTSVVDSDILYTVLTEQPDIISAIQNKYSSQKAINGAIKSAQKYGDIALIVSAAEANKTIAMLRTVWTSLYKLIFGIYDSVKKLKPREAYNVASDLWLQYRYGWRPLHLELANLYKLMTDSRAFSVRSAYGNVKFDNISEDFPASNVRVVSDDDFIDGSHRVNISEVTYKAGFNYFNEEQSRNNSLMAKLGLDIESILGTAWELIPWSFVLDMFVNIGDCISTLNFKNQFSPINGYLTTRVVANVETLTTRAGFSTVFGCTRHIPEDYQRLKFASNTIADPFRFYLDGAKFRLRGNHLSNGIDPSTVDDSGFIFFQDFENERSGADMVPERDFTPVYVLDVDGNSRQVDAIYQGPRRGNNLHGKFLMDYFYDTNFDVYVPWDGDTDKVQRVTLNSIVPSVYIKHYCEKVDIQSHQAACFAEFPNYVRLRKEGDYDIPNTRRNMPFHEHMRRRGISTYGLTVDTTLDGLRLNRVPGVECPEFRTLYKVYPNRSDLHQPFPKPVSHKLSGEFITRQHLPESKIDFKLVAEMDLNPSQITDLAIFGQRMLSAFAKR